MGNGPGGAPDEVVLTVPGGPVGRRVAAGVAHRLAERAGLTGSARSGVVAAAADAVDEGGPAGARLVFSLGRGHVVVRAAATAHR